MSINRVGPHYSSYHSAHGIRCIPFCNRKATHWECSKRYGEECFSCDARCDEHAGEPDPSVTIRPIADRKKEGSE